MTLKELLKKIGDSAVAKIIVGASIVLGLLLIGFQFGKADGDDGDGSPTESRIVEVTLDSPRDGDIAPFVNRQPITGNSNGLDTSDEIWLVTAADTNGDGAIDVFFPQARATVEPDGAWSIGSGHVTYFGEEETGGRPINVRVAAVEQSAAVLFRTYQQVTGAAFASLEQRGVSVEDAVLVYTGVEWANWPQSSVLGEAEVTVTCCDR